MEIMNIPEDLKTNLIADVENTLSTWLTNEEKVNLKRAFEITIGTYSLTKNTKLTKKLNNDLLADVSNNKVAVVCPDCGYSLEVDYAGDKYCTNDDCEYTSRGKTVC